MSALSCNRAVRNLRKREGLAFGAHTLWLILIALALTTAPWSTAQVLQRAEPGAADATTRDAETDAATVAQGPLTTSPAQNSTTEAVIGSQADSREQTDQAVLAGPPVFREAPAALDALAAIDRTITRSRAVTLDRAAFADLARGKKLVLNLFADTTLEATVSEVLQRPAGPLVSGKVVDTDPPGDFVLVFKGGAVNGRIIAPGRGTFLVRTLDGASSVIRQVDPQQFEPCTADEEQANAPEPDPQADQGVVATAQVCEDEDIDVLIVYTPLARDAAVALGTDINSLVQESAALTNLAFANSQVNTRINIVASVEVDYDESASNHMQVLINYSDGMLNEVRPLRDQYKADLVSLLVANKDNSCGSAFQPWDLWMPTLEFLSYSINKVSCMNSILVFPHEIGHNLGCAHDHDSCNVDEIIFPYAYGHWFRGDSGMTWGTVMSYIGQETPHFSNPDVLFDGEPTGVPVGDPRAANNALTINSTSPTIAKIRCGGPTDCNGNGFPDADDIAEGRSADANHNAIADECEVRLYVKPSAPAGGDCRSWATACRDLWDAIDMAAVPWSGVTEIWVASGTYKPDRGTGDRTRSFYLLNGVGFYGGFAGNEITREQRAGLFEQTILSGDLAGNDGPNFTNRTDNAYMVVDAWALDRTVILDGFTISGGHADAAPPFDSPGGLRCYNCNATFSNLIFRSNFAEGVGGGAHVAASTPSSPVFTDCTFAENQGHLGGAFGSFLNTEPTINGCVFTKNTAETRGGGAFTNGGHAKFIDCIFADNSAGYNGGGIAAGRGLTDNSITIVNSTFTGNRAGAQGGALFLERVTSTVENCVFHGNSVGGVYATVSGSTARIVIANSILWQNTPMAQINGGSPSEQLQVRNCILQHIEVTPFQGNGNISADPRFVNPLGEDWTPRTVDDDFRLLADSPAIDAGDNAFVSRHLDLAGRARIADADGDQEPLGTWATVDMGAFEFGSGELCGGVAGLTCDDPDEFCKLPVGGCCCEFHGVCTPYANACITLWDPVCGCDGETYGNECEAERAGVSVDYMSPCDQPCGRPGDLPCPAGSFCEFSMGTCGDSPTGGFCKDTTGIGCTAEYAPVCGCDGNTYGNACEARVAHVSVNYAGECYEPLAADQPGAPCTACAVSSCSGCTTGTCNNGQVSLCEVIAYGCAWMRGCNDDASALTRAGYIWRNGECYCFGEEASEWFPVPCGDGNRRCSGQEQGLTGVVASTSMPVADASVSLSAAQAGRHGEWRVTLDVSPPVGTNSQALEVRVPKGWKVVSVQNGGGFDAVHDKVKWGPYFDDLSRTVVATLRPTDGRGAAKDASRLFDAARGRDAELPVLSLQGSAYIDGRTVSAASK